MGETKFLKITEKYLEELIGLQASKLAGKSMKRFELFVDNKSNVIENATTLKKELKELVYESYRDLRDMLIAHNYGMEVKVFTLNEKKTQ